MAEFLTVRKKPISDLNNYEKINFPIYKARVCTDGVIVTNKDGRAVTLSYEVFKIVYEEI